MQRRRAGADATCRRPERFALRRDRMPPRRSPHRARGCRGNRALCGSRVRGQPSPAPGADARGPGAARRGQRQPGPHRPALQTRSAPREHAPGGADERRRQPPGRGAHDRPGSRATPAESGRSWRSFRADPLGGRGGHRFQGHRPTLQRRPRPAARQPCVQQLRSRPIRPRADRPGSSARRDGHRPRCVASGPGGADHPLEGPGHRHPSGGRAAPGRARQSSAGGRRGRLRRQDGSLRQPRFPTGPAPARGRAGSRRRCALHGPSLGRAGHHAGARPLAAALMGRAFRQRDAREHGHGHTAARQRGGGRPGAGGGRRVRTPVAAEAARGMGAGGAGAARRPAVLEEMGRRAREATAAFRDEAHVRDMEAVYRRVLGEPAPARAAEESTEVGAWPG